MFPLEFPNPFQNIPAVNLGDHDVEDKQMVDFAVQDGLFKRFDRSPAIDDESAVTAGGDVFLHQPSADRIVFHDKYSGPAAHQHFILHGIS